MSDPILLVVRRGALRRFDVLKRKTAQLDVRVIWDRREAARRGQGAQAIPDRRQGDRRRQRPYTWETADFTVVVPPVQK